MAKDSKRYNAAYYERNKERILVARKKRYEEDPGYREAARKRAAERGQRVTEKYRKRRDAFSPIPFQIRVGSDVLSVPMYTSMQIARALGKSVKTIRGWEKRGILPKAMYRDSGGWCGNRLYTGLQYNGIIRAYAECVKRFGVGRMENRISLTDFPKILAALWEKFPKGIDMNSIKEA
jgi:hypothetical protein